MIRNENEYKEAVRRLQEEKKRLDDHRAHLEKIGLTGEELQRAIDPLTSFHQQFVEEVESYNRLKRREVAAIENLQELGQRLVGLRIALGLTQRELAEKLGVSDTQVSRDERNEYHGATIDRVSRILSVLKVQMKARFELPDDPIEDKDKSADE
jgi:DNA-directed RNA polymerase specialized sigma subunit